MDPINQNNQDGQDLSQQYKNILDRYTKELSASKAQITSEKDSPVAKPTVEEPSIANKSQQYQDILDRYSKDIAEKSAPVSPQLPPIVPPAPTPTPSEDVLAEEIPAEETTPPPVNPLFKYIFYLSLLTFLGVCGAIGYNVYSTMTKPSSSDSVTIVPTVTSAAVSSPSVTPSSTCSLNDQSYTVGQTFTSADGCNTCSCNTDLTISCTDKSCDATSSSSITPTKAATISGKLTPTKSATSSTIKKIATPTPIK